MSETKRDGKWIDKWGACKVCDGEIPYGHTENCDIYKLEQEISKLKLEYQRLFEAYQSQCVIGKDWERIAREKEYQDP